MKKPDTVEIRIGVSTRALFDMEKENKLYQDKGLSKYIKYNEDNVDKILDKGVAFRIIRNMLALNKHDGVLVKVILMSRSCPEIATRVFNSLEHYGLFVEEAFFTGGDSLKSYVENSELDLYLSANEDDVKAVLDCGIAAGLVRPTKNTYSEENEDLRVAFDCDRVLFNGESDEVYENQSLEAYEKYEKDMASVPVGDGPFKTLLIKLGWVQEKLGYQNDNPVKIAICTARAYNVHERALKTIKSWGVRVSQAFFLAGNNKAIALQAFNADIFFDDSGKNIKNASEVVPSCQVLQ